MKYIFIGFLSALSNNIWLPGCFIYLVTEYSSFPVSLMARVAAWPRLSQADPDSESRVSHKGAEGGNVP